MSRTVAAFNHSAIMNPSFCPRIRIGALNAQFRPGINVGLTVSDPAIAAHTPTRSPRVFHQPRLFGIVIADDADAVVAAKVIGRAGRALNIYSTRVSIEVVVNGESDS